MNGARIEFVKIKGFRSLADVELTGMPQATVLIGPNGSGKSNIMRFFEMLSWMLRARRLQEYVQRQGGADDQLFGGSATTPRIEAEIRIRTEQSFSDYRFALDYAHPDQFTFSEESFRQGSCGNGAAAQWRHLGNGHREAKIVEAAQSAETPEVCKASAAAIVDFMSNCSLYQFHDTSDHSAFKKRWDVSDNHRLLSNGGNLAAVLYRLERQDLKRYEWICRLIARELPGFDRFAIEEEYGKVLLRWRAKWSGKTFSAHLTSDGSLRLFALATLLSLPPEMLPDVIFLDEPELGLHPAAVSLLGGLIQSISVDKQVIVATQSPLLVDAFEVKEIFVLELEDGQTKRRKLDADGYWRWFEDGFTTGQLWRMNLFGGRP